MTARIAEISIHPRAVNLVIVERARAWRVHTTFSDAMLGRLVRMTGGAIAPCLGQSLDSLPEVELTMSGTGSTDLPTSFRKGGQSISLRGSHVHEYTGYWAELYSGEPNAESVKAREAEARRWAA